MRSLSIKLIIAFMIISLAAIALVALVIGIISSQEFNRFLLDRQQADFISAVTTFYENNGSWAGVQLQLQQLGLLPPPPKPGEVQPLPQPFALTGQGGAVIIGGGPYRPGDRVPANILDQGTAIVINGQTVGVVLVTGNPPIRDQMEQTYLTRTNQALLVAALGGLIIALILGILFAHTITRPIRELTKAANLLATGKFGQQVPVISKDELGRLSTTFNQMSTAIERSNQLRRQMTADIAHDLRTPLAVIAGYLESLRDGVLQPSPQRFELLYKEAHQLQRLVEDLRTLSLADSGDLTLNLQNISPIDLLNRGVHAFQHKADQKQITLSLSVEEPIPNIVVDPERFEQVLGNLTSNALRYTPQGGKIVFFARKDQDGVLLGVKDNGKGIIPEDFPHIFDRSYRGDKSRQQQSDESGLGLAIAKSIVELHGGRISASSGGLNKGTQINILIPIKSNDPTP